MSSILSWMCLHSGKKDTISESNTHSNCVEALDCPDRGAIISYCMQNEFGPLFHVSVFITSYRLTCSQLIYDN